jgi:hypothetical protein
MSALAWSVLTRKVQLTQQPAEHQQESPPVMDISPRINSRIYLFDSTAFIGCQTSTDLIDVDCRKSVAVAHPSTVGFLVIRDYSRQYSLSRRCHL